MYYDQSSMNSVHLKIFFDKFIVQKWFVLPSLLKFHIKFSEYLAKNFVFTEITNKLYLSKQNFALKRVQWTEFATKFALKNFFIKFALQKSLKCQKKIYNQHLTKKYYFIKTTNKFQSSSKLYSELSSLNWHRKKTYYSKKHQAKNSPYERLNYPKNSNNRRMWRTPQTIFDKPSLALTRQREGQ